MTITDLLTARCRNGRGRFLFLWTAVFLIGLFLTAWELRASERADESSSNDYSLLQKSFGDSEESVVRGQVDYSQNVFIYGEGNKVESVSAEDKRLSSVTRPITSYSRFSTKNTEKEEDDETEDEEETEEQDSISSLSAPVIPRLNSNNSRSVSGNPDTDSLSEEDFPGIFPEGTDPQNNSVPLSDSSISSDDLGGISLLDDFPQDSPSFPAADSPLSDMPESSSADDPFLSSSVSGNEVQFGTVSAGQSLPAASKAPSAPISEYDYSDFADIDTLDSGINEPLPNSSEEELLPEDTDFPEFAKNAYRNLEPTDQELTSIADPREKKAVPERERKSIADKEKEEEELKAEYSEWLAKQKSSQKEKEKLPSYLQPLEDDRSVFNGPDSPYSRDREKIPEQDHTFVREISAADLNMMSNVSSNRELMDWEKEQDMPVDWSKYSAKTLYNKWRDYLGMGPNEKEALAIMKKATLSMMEYEKEGNIKSLREASDLFEKAGKKWPDSVLEEDALFYAGECYFFDNNYTKAKTSYKALLTKYSNSVLRRDAMERLYCIGVYWVKCAEEDPEVIGRFEGKERPRFSDFAGAKDAFETIFTNDVSDKGRGPDAVFALANAYMRRGVEQGDASFEEAAKYYQRLYEFYPSCKYADKAYQLTMLALYQSYRGPFYDSTPLKKAEEIAKTAQRAHKGDQDVIAEQLRLIKEKQAEYLLVRGEYYEKKKLYASARSYYNQLVSEYPESEYAAKGAERYTAIRENPAESDQFALVRPIAPFLPKSNNQYFEDQPSRYLDSAVAASGGKKETHDDLVNPDYTELEKTADAGTGKDSGREVR